MVIRKIKNLFYYGYYYITAHIILLFHYDKKYITKRWFYEDTYRGLIALGWKWIVIDYKMCKKYGVNRDCPWPANPQCRIASCFENISFAPEDLNFFQGNVFFQTYGKISIEKGTFIANNVGIITANHDLGNLDEHSEAKAVNIGEECWIGMNAVILPGVTLGPHTFVGAGSVVTKSFPEGRCVIVGNPARKIKEL